VDEFADVLDSNENDVSMNRKNQLNAPKPRQPAHALVGALLAFALALAPARIASASSILVPLAFDCTYNIVDERGRLLPGTAAEPGAYIEILEAPAGVFPPAVNGAPHPSNRVIATAYIGQGTDPGAGPLGKASGLLMIDRSSAKPLFARVFNRRSPEESSFYADSSVFTNFSSYEVFQIDVTSTHTPLDVGDEDGDRLHNSWEKSLWSDPYAPDSDGDEMSDYEEFLAGTDPIDHTSYFGIGELSLRPWLNGIVIRWSAAFGRAYQLQHAPLDINGDALSFSNIGETIVGDQPVEETQITNPPSGILRIIITN
jgi:hypothetical protein